MFKEGDLLEVIDADKSGNALYTGEIVRVGYCKVRSPAEGLDCIVLINKSTWFWASRFKKIGNLPFTKLEKAIYEL